MTLTLCGYQRSHFKVTERMEKEEEQKYIAKVKKYSHKTKSKVKKLNNEESSGPVIRNSKTLAYENFTIATFEENFALVGQSEYAFSLRLPDYI